jgi:hypothetical protein
LAEVAESPKGKVAAFWKFVYIAEAHAMDEWPVKSARFNQGRGPVVVEKQPTWPLRLYLICDSKIEWIAEPRSCSYADAVTELMKILNLT